METKNTDSILFSVFARTTKAVGKLNIMDSEKVKKATLFILSLG
jgi:hypothetical protein